MSDDLNEIIKLISNMNQNDKKSLKNILIENLDIKFDSLFEDDWKREIQERISNENFISFDKGNIFNSISNQYSISIHKKAFQEFEAAINRYEYQLDGLGEYFKNEVVISFLCITEFSDSLTFYVSGTKRFCLSKFPFAIVYSYEQDKIIIISFMHLYRKPGCWLTNQTMK
jgi:hypothetical protein